MKKILLISHVLNNSGAPRSLLNIAQVLNDNGYKVHLWSMQSGDLEKEFRKLNVEVEIINEFDFLLYDNVKLMIKKFDIAICNTVVTYPFVMRLHEFIPTIWMIREGGFLDQFIKNNDDIIISLKTHSPIYTVSEYAQSYLYNRYLTNSEVIHNYIEDDGYSCYRDSNKIKIFIVVGHISNHKGQNLVLRANNILLNKGYNNYKIYFVGNFTSEREYCEEFIEQIKEQNNVIYLGELGNVETKEMIKKSTAVIVPSRDETCSLVTLEAAMSGRPVLLSSNVGASYVVDDNSGWYFENNNIDSIAQCMEKVINEQDIEKYSNNIRRNYERTTQHSVFEKNVLKMVSKVSLSSNILGKNIIWNKWLINKRKNIIDSVFKKIKFNVKPINVIIYGVSSRGECIYNLLRPTLNIKNVFWMDKDYSRVYKDIEIISPNKIKSINYDYIFVTVKEKSTFKSICSDILELGVNLENVIWVSFNGVI